MQINGSIIKGHQFNNKIDFPTINIKIDHPPTIPGQIIDHITSGIYLGDCAYGKAICFITANVDTAEMHVIGRDLSDFEIKDGDKIKVENLKKIKDPGSGLLHTYYLGCYFHKIKKYYFLVILILTLLLLYIVRKPKS